jgi:uncharacterized lipoprotein YmbA
MTRCEHTMNKRKFLRTGVALWTTAAASVAALGGCATPAPPTRWYRLGVDAPAQPGAPPATPASTWEIARSVRLPEYLDRDRIVLASGSSGLLPVSGHRWAEPLAESVPRLLAHDLQLLRGAQRVWVAPAPAGAAVDRRLQVELWALHAESDRGVMTLRASWWLADVRGVLAPQTGSAAFDLPIEGNGVEGIVGAHRLALWRLAERIAATP